MNALSRTGITALIFYASEMIVKKVIFSLTLFMLLQSLVLGGCSQQWRDSDPGIDDQELFQIMTTVAGNSSDSGTNRFLELAQEDKSSVVYFAAAPGPMGAVESILAFDDLGVLDSQLLGVQTFDADPAGVTVFFVDSYQSETERVFGLMIEIQGIRGVENVDTISKVFLSEGTGFSFEDNEFTVELTSGNGDILLVSSYDVIPGTEDLEDVIQLKIIEVQSDGTEIIIGKFSTMVGFRGSE